MVLFHCKECPFTVSSSARLKVHRRDLHGVFPKYMALRAVARKAEAAAAEIQSASHSASLVGHTLEREGLTPPGSNLRAMSNLAVLMHVTAPDHATQVLTCHRGRHHFRQKKLRLWAKSGCAMISTTRCASHNLIGQNNCQACM